MLSILPALTDTVRVILPLHGSGVFFKVFIAISVNVQKRMTVSFFNTVCKVLHRSFHFEWLQLCYCPQPGEAPWKVRQVVLLVNEWSRFRITLGTLENLCQFLLLSN